MAKLFTLTVPDVLWINLQVTGAPQKFNYATLEEATFYQYKNGANFDFAGQAARFLTGFYHLAPFADGNEATAFIGCVAFLEMNGHTLDLTDKDAAAWVKNVWQEPGTARTVIETKLVQSEFHGELGVPDTNEIVEGAIGRYPKSIASLSRVTA